MSVLLFPPIQSACFAVLLQYKCNVTENFLGWFFLFHLHFLTFFCPTTDGTLQSTKVSRSSINRLTRRDRRRRGQETTSVKQRDKPHVSFSNATPASKITGPNLTLRRQTILLEDGLDSAPYSHRASICSWPDLNTDAPISGSRSLLSHQTADNGSPPPSSFSPSG